MDLKQFKENLPKIREMFNEVPAIGLGTQHLKPEETVVNNRRHRIIVDVQYGPVMEILTGGLVESEVDLWERVLYGAPFIIKNLLAYSAELEAERDELRALGQAMFDPENQPPQWSTEDAWKQFRKISKP